MFVLQVQDIDASGKDYRFELDAGWLGHAVSDAGLRPGEGGVVEVHAQRAGAEILVQGTVNARVVAECVRCLGDAPIDVHARITSLLSARASDVGASDVGGADEVELSADDLEREFYSGDQIVLDPLVREHILLECPMQPLCDEDCEGIAVPEHLRADDAVDASGEHLDPRLLPLLKLAGKLSNNEE
jgi:uncharacterized protein